MRGERYFFGLDGGGTKTHGVLYDREKDRLEFLAGGATNHESLPGGFADLPDAIAAVAVPLAAKMGLSVSEIDSAVFGMGGVDTPRQKEIITAIIADLGFRNFILANDACLGVKAECGGTGIGAVNGTGCSVVGVNSEGEMAQVGGFNELSGDLGGGVNLVPAAVRAVYRELFKDGSPTAMTGMLQNWLGTADPALFCQEVTERLRADRPSAFGAISRILYLSAASGDGEAKGILTACGEDYALSIRCAAGRLGLTSPVEVALIGSHFTKCEDTTTIDTIRRLLDPNSTGEYRLRVISTEPVAGALLWALERAGIKPEPEERAELKRRIKSLRG